MGGVKKAQAPVDTEKPASEACCLWRWRASYSMLLRRRRKTLYKGSILLDAEVNRVVPLDTDETVIDACDLKEGELINPGSVFEFPCHKVEIGERILQSKEPPSKRMS